MGDLLLSRGHPRCHHHGRLHLAHLQRICHLGQRTHAAVRSACLDWRVQAPTAPRGPARRRHHRRHRRPRRHRGGARRVRGYLRLARQRHRRHTGRAVEFVLPRRRLARGALRRGPHGADGTRERLDSRLARRPRLPHRRAAPELDNQAIGPCRARVRRTRQARALEASGRVGHGLRHRRTARLDQPQAQRFQGARRRPFRWPSPSSCS